MLDQTKDGGKREVNGYTVTQSVTLNRMEIIVGENLDTDKPYMTWRRFLGEPFGAEKHIIPEYNKDYITAIRGFIRCLSACADNLDLDRAYRGSQITDFTLTAKHCVPNGLNEDNLFITINDAHPLLGY